MAAGWRDLKGLQVEDHQMKSSLQIDGVFPGKVKVICLEICLNFIFTSIQ